MPCFKTFREIHPWSLKHHNLYTNTMVGFQKGMNLSIISPITTPYDYKLLGTDVAVP